MALLHANGLAAWFVSLPTLSYCVTGTKVGIVLAAVGVNGLSIVLWGLLVLGH